MSIEVMLGTNDLNEARAFYDVVLAEIGMERIVTLDNEIGYGIAESSYFWITIPYDQQPATRGNGTQVTFKAKNNDQVDSFYQAVLKAGGVDEGCPGFRYRENYYGAYCRDLNGNKLHVMYEPKV